MKIYFLSGLFPKNLRKEIEENSKGNIQYASDTFQWNLLNGLNFHLDSKLFIVNAPLVGSFPKFYKKLSIRESYIELNKNQNKSIQYYNIPIIKNSFIKSKLVGELNKLHKQNDEFEDEYIIVYGMLAPWVEAAVKFKKKYPKTKLCLVIPDLPEYMNETRSFVHKIRIALQRDLYPYLVHFDSFIYLTKEMNERINKYDKPWDVIEGMVNPDDFNANHKVLKSEKKAILYTGTLAQRYGIKDLLDAFSGIDDDRFELWICGAGDSEELIRMKAKQDGRIKFYGLLSREKVLDLQRKATVLINPRNADDEFTKYSFPSKIMEYMLSGTPAIIKALPGIPDEYFNYLYVISNSANESLQKKIIEVLNKEEIELRNFGLKAQNFVIEKKNYIFQSKKIVELFKRIL